MFPPHPWHLANSAELGPLIHGHYSRRREHRRGRLGGVGTPVLLATCEGSALIATRQGTPAWDAAWATRPCWWLGLYRRHAAQPEKASHLLRLALRYLTALEPLNVYTTTDAAHAGTSCLYAGMRPHCSTRPFKRSRSLTVWLYTPRRPTPPDRRSNVPKVSTTRT